MAAMPPAAGDSVNKNRGVYLLPTTTQFECVGSVTASNRSIQWREKVIDPLFESVPDHVLMQAFADRLGFGKELSKNFKMMDSKFAGKTWKEPEIESILREINQAVWTIGLPVRHQSALKRT